MSVRAVWNILQASAMDATVERKRALKTLSARSPMQESAGRGFFFQIPTTFGGFDRC